ncbi:reverse transcriptase domain-containing protein [Tanacetum coccineum]
MLEQTPQVKQERKKPFKLLYDESRFYQCIKAFQPFYVDVPWEILYATVLVTPLLNQKSTSKIIQICLRPHASQPEDSGQLASTRCPINYSIRIIQDVHLLHSYWPNTSKEKSRGKGVHNGRNRLRPALKICDVETDPEPAKEDGQDIAFNESTRKLKAVQTLTPAEQEAADIIVSLSKINRDVRRDILQPPVLQQTTPIPTTITTPPIITEAPASPQRSQNHSIHRPSAKSPAKLEQDMSESLEEIIKHQREQERETEPTYTIKLTDKAALEEFDLKSAFFKFMHKNKSANRNPAKYRLYHALMEVLIEDENAMDKEVADTGKLTKRRRTRESESAKKPSTTKESSKDKDPKVGSKTGKSATFSILLAFIWLLLGKIPGNLVYNLANIRPSVPMPHPFINPEEDARVEETLTDPEHGEFTIKVPPPLVQKAKPSSQRNFVVHQRDPRYPHIPYPSRMNQEKQQEKDEVQIYKFWQMFKQFHVNIYLADALILIPKYQKLLKSLLSNKEKLLELANTSLNENCSAAILKKLPEKLGDPGKFLIPCGFSKLKCKALADLGASINLMPLSVWKKLGLPELISTRMTLELANRAIYTPAGIARDVFVLVGKFIFPADFIIVDYESDPRVPLILGRPFLRTACALIDVHGEEMILRDGDERLILNMKHDTSSYSNNPQKESINMIDIYNVSYENYLKDLFKNEKITNHPSGNPTSSLTSHTDLTSSEVNDDIFDPEGDIIEKLLNLDKTKDLHPYHDNPVSDSTTSSLPSLLISETSDYFLEEFADELAHFTFPPGIDYLPFDAESDLREIDYLLNHDPTKEICYP